MTTDVETRGPAVTLADVEAISRDDPEWLRKKRLEAWRLYESMDLPDPGDEEWRRTDVRAIPIEGLRPARFSAGPAAVPELSQDLQTRGVILSGLNEAASQRDNIVREHLYRLVEPDEWKYVALNAAAWSEGVFLYVPKGVEVTIPVNYVHGIAGGGETTAFSRVLIVVEENSRLTFIDETSSEGEARGLVSGAVEIFAGDGAKVEYYNINRWGRNVYNFNTVRARLGKDAQFLGVAVGLGSKLTKMRVDTLLPETGARVDLLGLTFGDGDQHFDYNTLQDHYGKHTQSELQFKSALTDSASLVWYGVTHIRPSAGGSAANQTSRNLLLSEHAKAAPIPILEIEAYDVEKCSHGATVGPVDENELFYLQSRAIPRDVAERMLVEGYFADVVARIPDARLRARIMGAVLEKMGGAIETFSADDVLGAVAAEAS